MGALIVVLVVLSQLAKAQARETREQGAQAVAEQIAAAAAEEAALAAQLSQLRQLKTTLAARIAETDLHAQRLAAEVQRLKQQVAVTSQKTGSLADMARLNQQLENLKAQQIFLLEQEEELQQALKKAKEKQDQPSRSFAIVPYRGPNETFRRPVYIECRADGVVLHPSGVRLSANDFPDTMGPGNPLSAALRATAVHYQSSGEQDVPYPFLLVRPNGIMAYYAARVALQWMDNEVGYELIDGEWDLALPKEDPQLTQVQARAVDASRQVLNQTQVAQRSLLDTTTGGGPETPRSYRVSRSLGGLVPADGMTPGDYDEPPRTTMPPGGFRPTNSSANDRYGAGGNSSTPYGSPGSKNAYAGSPGGTDRYGNPSDSNRYGEQGGSGTPNGGDDPFSPQIGRYGSNQQNQNPDGSNSPGGANGPNSRGGTTPNGSDLAADPSSGYPSTQSSLGQNGSGQMSGNQTTGQTPSGQSGGGQSGGQRPQDRYAGNTSSGSSSGSSAGSPSSSGSAGGSPSSGAQSASGPANFGGSGSPSGQQGSASSMANQRGKDWAIRSIRGPGTTAVTRPIRVICDIDRVVLLSEDRIPRAEKIITLESHTAAAVDPLQQAVTRRVQSWGIAGAGMYWRPTLQMEVTPLGQKRFEDFAILLENSGYQINRKQISSASIGRTPTTNR